MAGINQLMMAALTAGFVRTGCVHDSASAHLVYDYPSPLVDGQRTPHWRVHVDQSYPRTVTYITWPGGQQRVSLTAAIDFMRRTARDHPKEK